MIETKYTWQVIIFTAIAALAGSCTGARNVADDRAAPARQTPAASMEAAPIIRVTDFHSPESSRGDACPPNSGGYGSISSLDMVTKGAMNGACL
jgi:hypothetical protein